jgi:mono/diheme cytochrome c family protein
MQLTSSIRRGLAIIVSIIAGTAGSLLFLAAEFGQSRADDVHSGKLPYDLHCARCHGPKGLGDGPQARHLKVPPPNFQSATFQSQSDDQILSSIEFGEVRSQMHASKGRLTDAQIRDVMAYIRQIGRER